MTAEQSLAYHRAAAEKTTGEERQRHLVMVERLTRVLAIEAERSR